MKIKIFIITYNNNNILQEYALNSLELSDYPKESVEVFIIDNYGNVDENLQNVKVLKNNLRSSKSTGHLSRNWNQAIILGFEDLDNPACDVVIALQNDTRLNKDWYKNLCLLLNSYDYITQGAGDQLQIFTPAAIKNIGLYDERFCNIGFQEADYFLRARLFYKNRSSINDSSHERLHNKIGNILLDATATGWDRGEPSHKESYQYHRISLNVFNMKWNVAPEKWDNDTIENTKLLISNFILYPYFEKKINANCLQAQNYNI
jgi:hypothetical protein